MDNSLPPPIHGAWQRRYTDVVWIGAAAVLAGISCQWGRRGRFRTWAGLASAAFP